jgi:hypothetical protein
MYRLCYDGDNIVEIVRGMIDTLKDKKEWRGFVYDLSKHENTDSENTAFDKLILDCGLKLVLYGVETD